MLAIDLQSVSLARGGRDLVSEISWQVQLNTTAALLGPNGCGKSTLLRILLGYWYPTCGRCTTLGMTLGRCNVHALRRQIRLVGTPGPYDFDREMTVAQVVASGREGNLLPGESADDAPAIASLLHRVGLAAQAEQAYGTLSSGQRVRCLLARALLSEPMLLLLDEPTASLDLVARQQVLELIDSLAGSRTIVMVTHHVEELPASTENVLLMSPGRVLATGSPSRVLTSDNCSRAFDADIEVVSQDNRFAARVRASDNRARTLD